MIEKLLTHVENVSLIGRLRVITIRPSERTLTTEVLRPYKQENQEQYLREARMQAEKDASELGVNVTHSIGTPGVIEKLLPNLRERASRKVSKTWVWPVFFKVELPKEVDLNELEKRLKALTPRLKHTPEVRVVKKSEE